VSQEVQARALGRAPGVVFAVVDPGGCASLAVSPPRSSDLWRRTHPKDLCGNLLIPRHKGQLLYKSANSVCGLTLAHLGPRPVVRRRYPSSTLSGDVRGCYRSPTYSARCDLGSEVQGCFTPHEKHMVLGMSVVNSPKRRTDIFHDAGVIAEVCGFQEICDERLRGKGHF
jgi:hypothetical protein